MMYRHPHAPGPSRRRWLAMAAACLAAAGVQAAEFPEISWDDLVPKGWDPLKSLGDTKPLSDNDPRALKQYEKLREIWDNAPTVAALAGRQVRLPGYLVPLDEAKDGIREFLLVPYFGACIHTPPPPANQIVHARTQAPIKGFQTMDAVWVDGTLGLVRGSSEMGASGYSMVVAKIQAYKRK
jgi:hypothetical protein